MSWIHIDDLVRLIVWCIEQPVTGAINATSPNPVTSNELMATFRKIMRRPKLPNVPTFLIKAVCAIVGIQPSILLASTRAVPEIAASRGFRFEFNKIDDALKTLIKAPPEAWKEA